MSKLNRARREARGRAWIVGARVVMLCAAAGLAVAAAWIVARGRAPSAGAAPAYTCPMHPEVRAAAPGECPICRMALEPAGAGRGPSRRELAGMSDVLAVENIRKHNIVDFVRRRTPLYNAREMRGPAWVSGDGVVTAIFYRDQVSAMATGEAGTFSLSGDAAAVSTVRRTDEPPSTWDSSTALVRFHLEAGPRRPPANARPAPRPGAIGWLALTPRPREVLTVPASAVIQSPEGPYVLVSIGGFEFEKRSIEIGETFAKQGFAVVLAGLRANERVVARATFFIEANRRLGNRLGPDGEAAPAQ